MTVFTRNILPKIRSAIIRCAALIMLTAGLTSQAEARSSLPDENLNYKVLFKWGLVHKTAGRVSLSMRSDGDAYKAIVYARSEPWADRIYSLRDTLTTEMSRTTLVPKRYERIAHENGRYECDLIEFTQIRNEFSAKCTRMKRKKNQQDTTTNITNLKATGMTVDFISAFYYLRTLDFPTMLPGHAVTINIFSGRRKELLRFAYRGIEQLEVEGKKYNAYKVEFTFTSDGKKETSDPITAWITTDQRRIPLQIEGKLKVGKIRCVLTHS